jgi:anti-sigma-K factor RskA
VSRWRIDPLDVALGEVAPGREAEEAARLMRDDARFRAEVERVAPVVARLERQPADTWRAPEPPPLLVGSSPPPVRAPWRNGFVLRPAVALAACVALLAAGAGAGLLAGELGGGPQEPDPAVTAGAEPARSVTLAALPARPDAHGVAAVSRGAVSVRVGGLAPTRGQGFCEVWLLNAPDDLVSLGTFRVGADGTARVRLPVAVDPGRFRFLDVSVEPADGDPAHSGRSVLRAEV